VFGTPLIHEIYALLFPEDQERMVMKYWMFAGEGISSRLAEQCLLRLSGDEHHESTLGLPHHPGHAYSSYYQRHISLSSVKDAKDAIRMRYAGIIQGGGNTRGIPGVSIEDVFLYPSGMTAIWKCHQMLAATIGPKIGPNTLKNVHVK
jgi:cystathionine gamma-synthase